MKSFDRICRKIGSYMNVMAWTSVYFIMMLIVIDVIGRFFGRPIAGSYELVSFAGAIAIGFSIPKTSLDRGHVSVDLLLERSSEATSRVIMLGTRLLSIALFVGLAWFLVIEGHNLYNSQQVSSTLHVPQCILVYLLAFCCLIECIALITDGFRVFVGGNQDE